MTIGAAAKGGLKSPDLQEKDISGTMSPVSSYGSVEQSLLIKATTIDKSRGAPALPQSMERLIKQGRLQAVIGNFYVPT